jgi:hypothetical protein
MFRRRLHTILEQHGTKVMVFERPKAVGTVTLNRIMSLKGALGHQLDRRVRPVLGAHAAGGQTSAAGCGSLAPVDAEIASPAAQLDAVIRR